MVWRETSVLDQRLEFCTLASLEGANVAALCRAFGISRQTGYVWLSRYHKGEALADRSRRPASSPSRCDDATEAAIVALRDAHPAWGARKIVRRMQDMMQNTGQDTGQLPPAPSSVHAVLRRHGRIHPVPGGPRATGRFERDAPNQLWQMDFKGRTRLACGTWCHALTVIDDHSRFAVALRACTNEQYLTVRGHLETALRHHGLPEAIYTDNGNPWGTGIPGQWTRLRVWLLKLGIRVIHARPYHPQGRGKNERFHRALKAEVFALAPLRGLEATQQAFDTWRHLYNHMRPHQGLDMAVPASRWTPSPRSFPQRLPEPEYDDAEIVRRVSSTKAYVHFKGRQWSVPAAFCTERLAIRPLSTDGLYGVFFGATKVASINLNTT